MLLGMIILVTSDLFVVVTCDHVRKEGEEICDNRKGRVFEGTILIFQRRRILFLDIWKCSIPRYSRIQQIGLRDTADTAGTGYSKFLGRYMSVFPVSSVSTVSP